jgi:putative ABC transport system permease protein
VKRSLRQTDLRPNAKRDVSDELRFHLEMRTQEFIEAGMTPDDARRAAARAFGDVNSIGAELRAGRSARTRTRERRDRFHSLVADVAFAVRTLRKNPSFTIAALATLALGIGATTAVFTVVNGVLLRPLPYTEPSRLEMVWLRSTKSNLGNELPISSGLYLDVQPSVKSFSSFAAFRAWPYTLSSDGDAEQIPGTRVTPSFFPALGVHPMFGRMFADADAEPGAAHVAVIGYDLWQRRFGGNSAVVGRRIQLSGESFTVVGIMPSGFSFPRGAELPAGLQFGPRTEIWTPLSFTPKDRRDYGTLSLAAIGRLKQGATAEQARLELSTSLQRFLKANAPKLDLDYRLLDLQQQAGGHVRRGLLLLMGAVAFVLFIACANVTNLLVARTSARRREFAVRAALGAGRPRIARQLITENVLLATGGTALGVAFSVWATRAMLALVPGSLPRADDVRLDWRVVIASGVAAIVVGGIFGLVSALQVRWGSLAGTLHDAGARATGGRRRAIGRRALVTAEVSLSLMLVIGASLLALSFARLQRVQPGFVPDRTLTASIVLPIPGAFDPKRDGPTWSRFYSQLIAQLANSPGVQSVGAISTLPLTSTAESGAFEIVGQPRAEAGQAPHTQYSVVEGAYFQTLAIKLLAGRVFGSGDVADGPPVVIVNREFARRFLSDGSAVGRQIICHFDFSDGAPRTIVGIVDDVQSQSLDSPHLPQVYVPESQMPYPGLGVVIRSSSDALAVLPVLKREVKTLDSHLALANVRTMDAVFAESLARQRFSMTIIISFAACALALAMVGLYGVIALSVGQRRREIGVRMALGARPADVLRLVLGEGLTITLAGTALGLLGAVALSRVVTSLLYGVSATDAPIYGASAAGIVIVTLLATFIPARRATRVDPTSALRGDGG